MELESGLPSKFGSALAYGVKIVLERAGFQSPPETSEVSSATRRDDREPLIAEAVVRITESSDDRISNHRRDHVNPGTVRKVVGIRSGAISGYMKASVRAGQLADR